MTNGDPVAADAVVIRRFDATLRAHYSVDEETGEKRMRSGAFRWDPEADYNVIGCSVFREGELLAAGSDRWGCIELRGERGNFKIATAEAGDVRDVSRPTAPDPLKPFDVIEDKTGDYVPDIAHALISHDPGLRKADKYYQRLAMIFETHLDRAS